MNSHIPKLLYFLSILFIAQPSYAQWEMLTPNPSGESVVDIYMRDDSIGYLINAVGLYRTDNGAESWELIQSMDLLDANTDMDFRNGTGMIVGKNGHAIISNDHGNSWSTLNLPDNQDLNSVTIIDADTLILSSDKSLYTSSDGGINWQQNTIPIALAVRTQFTSGMVGHAACLDSYILKTTDGGASWVETAHPNLGHREFQTIYFVNSTIGFASHKGSAEFVTRDGGNTWTPFSISFDEVYAFDFINDSIGYAVGRLGIIYKTIDAGQTWADLTPDPRGLYRDFYAVDFLTENSGYVAGRKGKILRTDNGGNDWVRSWSYYFEITDLSFPTSDIGYATGRDIVLKTLDGGDTWDTLGYVFPGVKINKCYFMNPDTGLVVGQLNSFFRTTDGGLTWAEIPGSNFRATAVDMHFPDPDTGFVIGNNNGLSRFFAYTHDGGQTWNQHPTGAQFLKHIYFVSSQIGFGLSNNVLFKTSDGGLSWTPDASIPDVINNSLETIDFPTDSVGYISSSDGKVYKTTDQGTTWETLRPYSNTLRPMHFQDELRGFVLDRFGNYFTTMNGGTTWNSFDGEINWEFDDGPDHILTAEITPDGNFFVAGDFGRIYRNKGFSQINSIYKEGRLSNDINIYPNPSNGKINIYTEWNKSFQLVVNDLVGRQVYFNEKIDGSRIDLGFLRKGIYLIVIKYDNETYSSKIIIDR